MEQLTIHTVSSPKSLQLSFQWYENMLAQIDDGMPERLHQHLRWQFQSTRCVIISVLSYSKNSHKLEIKKRKKLSACRHRVTWEKAIMCLFEKYKAMARRV